jgi:hypothetical protein
MIDEELIYHQNCAQILKNIAHDLESIPRSSRNSLATVPKSKSVTHSRDSSADNLFEDRKASLMAKGQPVFPMATGAIEKASSVTTTPEPFVGITKARKLFTFF